MPRFRKSNVLFIHIPKTGGTSIERQFYDQESHLDQYSQESFFGAELPYEVSPDHFHGYPLQHYTYRDLLACLGQPAMDRFRVIFAVVRNPYHRMVSEFYYYYNHRLEGQKGVEYFTIDELQTQFQQFCQQVFQGIIQCDDHHKPQFEYIRSDRSDRNFLLPRINILHFERLDQEFRHLFGESLKFHELSSDRHLSYATHYNASTRKLVGDYYAKDFELLGYDRQDL